MTLLATLIALVVLAAVVWLISAPLRAQAAGRMTPAEERDAQRRVDLEIGRDQKYAEIRELEMDLRTGKLSDDDYRVTDRQLRAEAVNILHQLDRLGVPATEPPPVAPADSPSALPEAEPDTADVVPETPADDAERAR
jgi:hypothetical protein